MNALLPLLLTRRSETLFFPIHPDKAPGPDGFSASFFQSNWSIVGPAICKEIQCFFITGELPLSINETHIRLIPKIQSPKKVADYRPIALCNVYYKIISKLLALRLKPVLQSSISENQSAFIPGRIITDNVLITHEMLYYLKTSSAEKHCGMTIKTDISKAYDRLEWSFIQTVLEKMGFHEKWVFWMMQCIRSVSYSFLINEAVCGKVIPQRGIRQGDPLSPYIFILCGEVLSGLCKKAQQDGSLPGLRVATKCPRINHLLFADDTMIFTKSNSRCCSSLVSILNKYEAASGQKINPDKSSITFSTQTPVAVKNRVRTQLGIHNERGVGKYLGLPEHFGRKKKDLFASIVGKIKQRAVSWSTRQLSTAGKATMLQAVLSATPSYAMSAFELPVGLCKQIQSAFTRFWWDAADGKQKISWISWDTLTKPKKLGGLGFRDIRIFNQALLAKIAWRLITNPTCLLARVLLGKYCQNSSFLKTANATSSHGWKGILWGRDLLLNHLGKVIGNGEDTKVWQDAWILNAPTPRPIGPAQSKDQDLMVADLLSRETKEWNTSQIEGLLPELAQYIRLITPSLRGAEDSYTWTANSSGIYSVKSGYHSMKALAIQSTEVLLNINAPTPSQLTSNESFDWIKDIWSTRLALKLKFFLWKAANEGLATGENLQRRGLQQVSRCRRCNALESTSHILFHCPFAKEVWELGPWSDILSPHPQDSLTSLMHESNRWKNLPPYGVSINLLPWICWSLWCARNQGLFQNKTSTPLQIFNSAINAAREWERSQPLIPIPSQSLQTPTVLPQEAMISIRCNTDAAWDPRSSTAGLG